MKRLLLIAMCMLGMHSAATAQNLVQNGSFTVGNYDDPMDDQSGPPWHVAYGTPQVRMGTGCDKGQLQMWGNSDDGESIYQVLTTPIKKGHSYTLSACVSFWHDNLDNYTPYVRVRFSAANAVPSYPPWPTDNVAGEEIGHVQTSDQAYTTYTLPIWTAQNDYTNFGVDVEDDNVGQNSATWGHIDQITLTECSGRGLVTLPATKLFVEVPTCSRVDSAISLNFQSCMNDTAILNGIALRGSQNFQLGATGQLPRMIGKESIPFSYNAAEAGSDTAYIDVTFTLNGQMHDTTILVIAHQQSSTYNANSYADGTLQVTPGSTITVPIRMSLPKTFNTSGMAVHTITYVLSYDSVVIDIPPSQLTTAITPPSGWTVKNATNGNGELTVQFQNSGSTPIQDSLYLGTVTFTANQSTITSSLILPGALQLQVDSGYLGFCFQNEGDYIADVVLQREGVSTNGFANVRGFNVYPNPSRSVSELRVHFSLAEASSCEIVLSDILGSVKYRTMYGTLTSGEHALPLPIAGLPTGDYYVRLNQGGVVETTKVSILK